MTILICGVVLWIAAHLFKRVLPGVRARLGAPGRGMVTGLVLLSLALMVIGYRAADGVVYWGRSPMLTGINNLLMLVSVYLFAASGMKTALARRIRHPMLLGVLIWSVAHILVNGDTPSFVLFGGLGLWALLQMVLINAQGPWVAPKGKGAKMEWMALVGTIVVYGAIAGVHYALGYPAFG